MYQGTTPALLLRVIGKDLTDATVFVSIKTGTRVTTKTREDLTVTLDDEDTEVLCQLKQEETLAMSDGEAEVQIRYVTDEGNAYATNKARFTVKDVLYKKVIEPADGDGDA